MPIETLCIGVAGGTGSGKTTVAEEILRRVGAEKIAHINQDRYYRDLSHVPENRRHHHNFDHPASVEEELLIDHVSTLKAGRAADLPVYDFVRHVRTKEVERIEPRPVVLLEGILILALPELRELMDIRIFVDTDADLRFIRRLGRDMRERGRTVESVIGQYLETVRPMHLEFVEPSKRWADVIIPEGGFNTVALDLIISRINRMFTRANDSA
jgi:uridine kinase